MLDADSRSLPPSRAASRVRRRVATARVAGDTLVYQKIDSTLRGNVGAECAALLAGLDRRLAVVAPAFPANRRTTVAGVQLVDGVPVHETAAARDPAHPMHAESVAAALRSGADLPSVGVGLTAVRGPDPAAILRSFADTHRRAFAVVDAETDADLTAIARAVLSLGDRALPVGSAGLAAQLARLTSLLPLGEGPGEGATPARPSFPRSLRPLLVIGTVNPATHAQVDAVAQVTARQDPFAHSAAARAAEQLAGGPALLVTPSRRLDVPSVEVARRFARAVVRVVDRTPPDGLVLTGGDTARAVLTALGARAIDLVDEVLPGMPVGLAVGGRLDGRPVVTKAGGFGPPDALAVALRFLQAGGTP